MASTLLLLPLSGVIVHLHVGTDTSCQPGLMLLWRWGFCLSNNHAVPLCLMQLKEVVLKSGKVLRADVCVVGVGKGQLPQARSLVGWQRLARWRRSWGGHGRDGSLGLDCCAPWGCYNSVPVAKLRKAVLESPPFCEGHREKKIRKGK